MAVLHFPNDQQFVLIYDLIIIVIVMYFFIVVNAFSLDWASEWHSIEQIAFN